MKIFVIFAVFSLCRVIQFTYQKKTSGKICGKSQLLAYTAFQYLVSAVLSAFLLTDFRSVASVSPVGVVVAIVGGIAMFSSSFCSMAALGQGVHLVLTSLFSSISILIPTVASVFLFGETMSIWQIAGVIALLYAACLLLGVTKDSVQGFTGKGIGLLLGLFAADGITMLAQKCYPYYDPVADTAVYTFLAFGTAFLLTAVFSGIDMAKSGTTIAKVMHKDLYIGGAVLAAMLFCVMYLGVLSVPLMSAVILYSFVAGATLVIAFLVGVIGFREPVTKEKVIGLVIAVVSLVVINAV